MRLVTVNIHKGFNAFNRKFILRDLREAVRDLKADVVCLQEVLGEHKLWSIRHKSLWPVVPQYEFLADSIWPSYAYGRNAVYADGHHGNAIMSKYEIKRWKNWDISLSGLEKRGLLHCEMEVSPGKTLHVICVHLSLRENHRQQQLQMLCTLVNKIPIEEPVVVAGDFNDWRLKAQDIMSEQAGMREVYTDSHGSPAKTFPAFWPFLRLDRIYIRSTEGHDTEFLPGKPWAQLSDHKPLVADINL